jgi:hypothetical protein
MVLDHRRHRPAERRLPEPISPILCNHLNPDAPLILRHPRRTVSLVLRIPGHRISHLSILHPRIPPPLRLNLAGDIDLYDPDLLDLHAYLFRFLRISSHFTHRAKIFPSNPFTVPSRFLHMRHRIGLSAIVIVVLKGPISWYSSAFSRLTSVFSLSF